MISANIYAYDLIYIYIYINIKISLLYFIDPERIDTSLDLYTTRDKMIEQINIFYSCVSYLSLFFFFFFFFFLF